MKHLKDMCIGCEVYGKNFTKEHMFPVWLLKRTRTDINRIRWGKNKIPGLSCTIPLCGDCNHDFGLHLESPVAHIFAELEAGKGITDYEAELLVRWMWKFEGFHWHIEHPETNKRYSEKYTLRDRVLSPIDNVRSRISLAISLIDKIDPTFPDLPLGINSTTKWNALFVSGVFSKIAIMTSLSCFDNYIPDEYSIYHLRDNLDINDQDKQFFPKVGFEVCTEAVAASVYYSMRLNHLHDNLTLIQCF